jgi:Sulfotransferase family
MSPQPSARGSLSTRLSRRLWPLEAEALCAHARKKTGLEDFGEPALDPALAVLVDSLEREAEVHPLGRFLIRSHLRSLLATRLQLAEAWKRLAAALEATPIARPIFITGMPRSGSTFLHELLAEDPANRVPRVWELMFPFAPPGPQRPTRDPRIRKAAANLWWFRRLAPGADSIHPLRAESPHECVAIQSYTLFSEEFISMFRVPGYEAFLHAADLRPVYAWQRRFLQYLQLSGPARPWVLKAPDHVRGLEALFAAFPDAVVIQTHRNPLEVLESLTRMIEVLHGLFSSPGERRNIAAQEARMLADGMERALRFRDAHPELANRFLDVNYTELAADPLAVVRRLYQQLGMPLTELAAQRMGKLAAGRSRYRRSRAAPTLADLGLDPATEARRFERYGSRFLVPC